MSKIKEFEELNIDNYIDNAFGAKGTELTVKEKATLLLSSDIINMLEQIKKDAWNAAIKWAAKNAKIIDNGTISIVSIDVDRQSILNGLING